MRMRILHVNLQAALNFLRMSGSLHSLEKTQGNIKGFFSFYVRYSTLLHLPPLRFHCARRCWDRTQDCCDFVIDSQTLS
jgi:hypothetical protein